MRTKMRVLPLPRALGMGVALLLCAAPAWSYDFVVNSTADAVDAVPGDNQCLTAAGECTLRAAIMEANFGIGASILVPAGVYGQNLAGSSEDAAATGDLDILAQVSITGAGQGLTQIAGGNTDRVFDVRPGASLSLVDASVLYGNGVDDGCGIRNQGTLSLTRVRFAGNGFGGTSCVHGGAIFNSGSLDITDGLFENNAAVRTASAGRGGAVYSTGMANVTRAVFRANGALEGAAWYQSGATASALFADVRVTAHTNQLPVTIVDGLVDWQGGSIDGNVYSPGGNYGAMSISGGTVYLTNVTVSGNAASSVGAILLNGGSLDLHYVTVSANQARQTNRGAGVRVVGGTLTSRDSVIAGNFNSANGTDIDCEGVLGSQGYNLLGSSLGCTFAAQPTDLIGVAPLLGALADNGGPSPTHALLTGSPAIDAIPAASCGNSIDQRGITRPQGGGCDIGAYEFVDAIFKNGFE